MFLFFPQKPFIRSQTVTFFFFLLLTFLVFLPFLSFFRNLSNVLSSYVMHHRSLPKRSHFSPGLFSRDPPFLKRCMWNSDPSMLGRAKRSPCILQAIHLIMPYYLPSYNSMALVDSCQLLQNCYQLVVLILYFCSLFRCKYNLHFPSLNWPLFSSKSPSSQACSEF